MDWTEAAEYLRAVPTSELLAILRHDLGEHMVWRGVVMFYTDRVKLRELVEREIDARVTPRA